jgi:hypothetical protein
VGFVLADGLSYGVGANQAIFLAIASDRYFCLSPKLNEAFLALAQGQCIDQHHIKSLIADRIICDAVGDNDIRAVRVPVAERSLATRAARYTMAVRSPVALFDRVYVKRVLAKKGLSRLLTEDLSNLLYERSERGTEDIAEIVEAVHAAGRIFGAKDQCLSQSLLIRRQMQRCGYGAALVFGVRLLPFEAHCWLQRGVTVLDDHHEHVVQFTPVFAS